MTLRIAWALSVIEGAAEEALQLGMEHILNVSNAHVPLDLGDLQASGVASVDGSTGAVSYDTPYAVAQHENLAYHHTEGRTAKYLENAMNSERGAVLQIISRGVHGRLGD
ncbi:hypothetical protein [Tessaracoccus sp.]